jgi:hypothetical protein
MSCYFVGGTLLVERKPNDALRFLFDNHFWQKTIQEWINKLLSARKAVDGWSGLEEYGKRMKWPDKQVFSTPRMAQRAKGQRYNFWIA